MLTGTNLNTRSYTMTARAAQVAATRRSLMESAIELAASRPLASITLEDVATGAGTSVQTLLRHFDSRQGLLEATADYARQLVRGERRVEPGGAAAAVRTVVDHYEKRGDSTLLLLAQEETDPSAVADIVEAGKAVHRQWVEDAFAAQVTSPMTIDLLVVATDVYTWKLLRRDRGHTRRDTEALMLRLVDAVLKETP